MKGQRGFTLLEVMIATAIMAMGIVGALELFTGSMKLAGNADHQSAATILARELVDEELWRDALEDTQRSGAEGIYTWSVLTTPTDRELLGSEEDQEELHKYVDEMGLWLIQAEVHWEEAAGAQKTVLLETARIGLLPQ